MFPSKLYTLMTYFRLHHVGKVMQCAKKGVSYSPGLGDFAIGQVNSVFNLTDGQVMSFEEFA